MTRLDKISKFIWDAEGGYVDHPSDKGGPTNHGITLKTWQACGKDLNGDGIIDVEDLKIISRTDWNPVLTCNYEAPLKPNAIVKDFFYGFLVDWAWGSGPKTAIKQTQRLLGLRDDGIVGPATIKAINENLSEWDLLMLRLDFLLAIPNRDATQEVFISGWLNRLFDLYIYYTVCEQFKVNPDVAARELAETSKTQNTQIQMWAKAAKISPSPMSWNPAVLSALAKIIINGKEAGYNTLWKVAKNTVIKDTKDMVERKVRISELFRLVSTHYLIYYV